MWHSFVKALEWRALALIVDFTIAYLWTRKISLSIGIVSVASVIKILVFTIWHKKRNKI